MQILLEHLDFTKAYCNSIIDKIRTLFLASNHCPPIFITLSFFAMIRCSLNTLTWLRPTTISPLITLEHCAWPLITVLQFLSLYLTSTWGRCSLNTLTCPRPTTISTLTTLEHSACPLITVLQFLSLYVTSQWSRFTLNTWTWPRPTTIPLFVSLNHCA